MSLLDTVAALAALLGSVLAPVVVPAGSPPVAPRPVVIVEGTGSAEALPLIHATVMASRLREDGFQPFIFPLPGAGIGEIGETSKALAPFVDDVLSRTGASQVDLVGHSQGGIVSRFYINFLGGAGKVRNLVSLGVPHHGSQLANLAMLHGILNCLGAPFCQQVVTGSSFLRELNGDDDTFGPVRYTNIATALDLIVVPYTNAFQRSAGAVNVTVQQQCPLRIVEHVTLITDAAVYTGVRDALAGEPPTLDCAALLDG